MRPSVQADQLCLWVLCMQKKTLHGTALQVGGGDATLPQPGGAPGHGARRAHAHGLLQGARPVRAGLQGAPCLLAAMHACPPRSAMHSMPTFPL